MNNIGETFQYKTAHRRDRMTGRSLDWSQKPETYKSYPEARTIKLPQPDIASGPGMWYCMQNRRSERDYTTHPLALGDVSQLLWAGQGITHQEQGYEFRTAPSAGALYPIETYIVANSVTELKSGIYHYNIQQHALDELKLGDFSTAVTKAAMNQTMCAQAGIIVIWTAIFERSIWKYHQRAFRYVYLDAGHIAHAVALAGVGLGLGSCPVAAFFDDELNSLIGVDGNQESTLYLTTIGKMHT